MFVEHMPAGYTALDDPEHAVEAFQLRPGQTEQLLAWLASHDQPAATTIVVNGGPAVVLGDGRGVVGLGDYALLDDSLMVAVSAGEFAQRWWPDGEPRPGAA